MATNTTQYGNDSISQLKGADRVRKRPGVIFGSDGLDGCEHAVFEILSNSIDEAREGHGNLITLTYYEDKSIEVEDFGRGCPMDWNPVEKRFNWELVFCELYAGGKYNNLDGGDYEFSLGLNGLGSCATQYASEYMDVTVWRDGNKYTLHFKKGKVCGKKGKELLVEPADRKKTGTTIRWKADNTIFKETTTYNFDVLAQRLRELAFLNPGITIIFRDERLETPKEVTYKFEGGIRHYVTFLNEGKKIMPAEPIYISGETEGVQMEVAMQYNDNYDEKIYAYVNDINTKEGGTHLDGFKIALTVTLNRFLEKNEKLQKRLLIKTAAKNGAIAIK